MKYVFCMCLTLILVSSGLAQDFSKLQKKIWRQEARESDAIVVGTVETRRFAYDGNRITMANNGQYPWSKVEPIGVVHEIKVSKTLKHSGLCKNADEANSRSIYIFSYATGAPGIGEPLLLIGKQHIYFLDELENMQPFEPAGIFVLVDKMNIPLPRCGTYMARGFGRGVIQIKDEKDKSIKMIRKML